MKIHKSLRNLIAGGAAAATIVFCGFAQAEDGGVTFTSDIAPLMQKHCQECHRPGEAVPMPLLSYKDIRPWAKSIKNAVIEKEMPPWHADEGIGEWSNERRLTDEEIGTIVRWVDQGAPLGDPFDLPPVKDFEPGWKIGEPDVVFSFKRPEVIQANIEDQYRYVSMKTNFAKDRWLKAVECRPGNTNVVHHIIAFCTDPKINLASAASGGGFGDLAKGFSLLGGYAPGMNPFIMPEGVGIFVPAGATITFQMHYHKEPGGQEIDSSSIGMIFADYEVKQRYYPDAVFNPLIMIPPHAENHEINAAYNVMTDMELRTVLPHMHLRGKDMKVWAKYPDGETRDILTVSNYDFNWQTIYELKDPLFLPKGSKIYAQAHFDNSENNPFNPNPDQRVTFGEDTNSEMMFAFISYTIPNEGLNDKDPEFFLVGSAGE